MSLSLNLHVGPYLEIEWPAGVDKPDAGALCWVASCGRKLYFIPNRTWEGKRQIDAEREDAVYQIEPVDIDHEIAVFTHHFRDAIFEVRTLAGSVGSIRWGVVKWVN